MHIYHKKNRERERKKREVASSEVKPTEIGTKVRAQQTDSLRDERRRRTNLILMLLLTTTNKLEIKFSLFICCSSPHQT